MPALQSYRHLLETSRRVNWRLEDLLGGGRRLDFTRPFLPETFAQTEPLVFLSPSERLKLNQIRARGYLALFELVEAFVMPFISRRSWTSNHCSAPPAAGSRTPSGAGFSTYSTGLCAGPSSVRPW